MRRFNSSPYSRSSARTNSRQLHSDSTQAELFLPVQALITHYELSPFQVASGNVSLSFKSNRYDTQVFFLFVRSLDDGPSDTHRASRRFTCCTRSTGRYYLVIGPGVHLYKLYVSVGRFCSFLPLCFWLAPIIEYGFLTVHKDLEGCSLANRM